MNIILKSLAERGVALPDTPQNLQPALRAAGIGRTYCILMTGRCGSTWLASALAQVDGINQPREYFSEEAIPHYGRYDGPQSYADYLTHVARSYGEDGSFGFKTNPNRLFPLSRVLNLAQTFSADYCAWIDMRRVNIVKQAFSFVRAMRSGRWHRRADTGQDEGAKTNMSDAPITDADIWHRIAIIVAEERQADRFYARNDLAPLRLVYEELLDSKWQMLARVAEHIRPGSVTPEMLSRLSDGTEKLSAAAANPDEERFVCTHAAALNTLNRHRATADPEKLRAWVQGGMVGPITL